MLKILLIFAKILSGRAVVDLSVSECSHYDRKSTDLRENWAITTSMGDYSDKYKINIDLILLDAYTCSFELAYDEWSIQ